MKIKYEIIQHDKFEISHRNLFAVMLHKQGKVQGYLNTKLDRCRAICIVKIDEEVVSIGAIKQKTKSAFSIDKAGIPELAKEFEWELGYMFTDNIHEGLGIASEVARLLIDNLGRENLMASTELIANPAMVHILEKNGFKSYGKPWKSELHSNNLSLFLKFR